MGRRKGSKNKKKVSTMQSSVKKSNYESKNITSIIVLFIGVVLGAIIFCTPDGSISKYLSNILGGLFGMVKYILPFIFAFLGLYGILNGKDKLKSKTVQTIIGLVIIGAIVCWSNYIYDSNLSFSGNLKLFYDKGIQGTSGGAIGAIGIIPLYQMFGKIPALIILICLTCIMFVLITGIMPDVIFYAIKDFFSSMFNLVNNNEIKDRNQRNDKQIKEHHISQEKNHSIDNQLNINKKHAQIEFNFFEDDVQEENKVENNEHKEIEDKVGDLNELFRTKTKEEVKKEKEEENRVHELVIEHNELEANEQEYIFPPIDLLNSGINNSKQSNAQIKKTAEKLQETLDSFHVKAKVVNVSKGPSVTRYELQPDVGVKVSQIVNLADDIALNLAASNIRIEAPIPGKAAVGIEVPNKVNEMVTMRELLESGELDKAESKVAYTLGKDIGGEIVISDIAKMPHMLISGATGSGKSVCINTMITSILYHAKPSEVKLLMIDPKVVELGIYNGIPHLLIPVVTDPRKAAGALNWAVQEMISRYNSFAARGVKDINGYNNLLRKENEKGILPQIVIIIDELADLMMVSKNEVEDAICRLAQMARAAGMHLVIATQRPSVDVITGIIKANIPSRIAFAVSSQVDSRTILDMVGAEKLLGKGDMLYYPIGKSKPIRLQGAFISEKEIEKVVEFIKQNQTANYDEDIIDKIENAGEKAPNTEEAEDADPLLAQAIDTVVSAGQASTSMIQRKFKVGYARAGRIIDQMEARGIISGYDGSKPRQVLISKEDLQELKMSANSVEEQKEDKVENTQKIAQTENRYSDENLRRRDLEDYPIDELNTSVVDGDYE